jgi:hypothetical protein
MLALRVNAGQESRLRNGIRCRRPSGIWGTAWGGRHDPSQLRMLDVPNFGADRSTLGGGIGPSASATIKIGCGSSPFCNPIMPSMPKRTAERLEQVVEVPWVWASLTKSSTITRIPSYMTTCLPKASTVVSSRLPNDRRSELWL